MFECRVCMESYHPSRRVARLLLCGHEYCQHCLEEIHKAGRIICPKCSKEHQVESVESCPVVYLAYTSPVSHSAKSVDASVEAGPQKERQGRRRRKLDAMKEEQIASLVSTKPSVTDKIEILLKYHFSVENMGVRLDELVEAFQVMIELARHARGDLTKEAEKVTNACNDGEEIPRGIDKILQKLSDATTPEQIAVLVDEADSQIEAAEEWIEKCGVAHPDVSTIHLAAKMRDVFTKGLRRMVRLLQDLQLPYVIEMLSRLSDFMAHDDIDEEDGTKGVMTPEDGAQGDLIPEDGARGLMTPEDGARDLMTPKDGARGGMTPEDGARIDRTPEDGARGDLSQYDAVKPTKVTVESLRCRGGWVEELMTTGLVFVEDHHEGRPLYGQVTCTHDTNHLCLHHLHDQSLPVGAHTVPFSELVSSLDVDSRLVFLDLSWPGALLPRRVTIRLQPETPLGTQFFLLATGQKGPSYANTRLGGVLFGGHDLKHVYGGDYDGKGGKAIVPGLDKGQYKARPYSPGVVTGLPSWTGVWNTKWQQYGAGFVITTQHQTRTPKYAFGQVERGLYVVIEAANLDNDGVKNITISDCGVMVACQP